jgi:hypothetical protein
LRHEKVNAPILISSYIDRKFVLFTTSKMDIYYDAVEGLKSRGYDEIKTLKKGNSIYTNFAGEAYYFNLVRVIVVLIVYSQFSSKTNDGVRHLKL